MKEGWKMVKLGKIVKLIADGDWIESKDQSHEGIRLIQTGNIGVGFFKDKSDSCRYISESTFNKLKCTEIYEGDCLVSRLPDPVGRACIIPCTNTRMITAVDCSILRFDNSVLPRWFVFYSQSKEYFNKVDKESTGSTRKRISRKNLSQIEIPLPPLEEQHRIVSILDASFEKIDVLKKNAEVNLKNAKALFQQVLAQELKPKEGWVEKKLEEIVTETCSLSYGIVQPGDDVQNGIPVVRPVDFSNDIFVKREGLKRTKKEISDAYQRTILTGNEILMCVRGTTGTMGFATDELKGCNVTRGIVPILIDKTSVKRFVYYQLLSPLLQKQIAENTNGTALKQINIKDLRVLKLFMPSIEEQHRIVRTLDTLSEKCSRLEQIAQQTIRECDALKQSILRQAFSGEL